MRPLTGQLSALIADLLGVPESAPAVGLAAASVLGQCVYYLKMQSMVTCLHPQLGDDPDVDRLADHIAAFSLAGIRGQRRAIAPSPRRRGVDPRGRPARTARP